MWWWLLMGCDMSIMFQYHYIIFPSFTFRYTVNIFRLRDIKALSGDYCSSTITLRVKPLIYIWGSHTSQTTPLQKCYLKTVLRCLFSWHINLQIHHVTHWVVFIHPWFNVIFPLLKTDDTAILHKVTNVANTKSLVQTLPLTWFPGPHRNGITDK